MPHRAAPLRHESTAYEQAMNGQAMGRSQFSCYQMSGGGSQTDQRPSGGRTMHKLLTTIAAAAAFIAAGSVTNRADAMPLGDPLGSRTAIDDLNIVDNVQYFWGGRRIGGGGGGVGRIGGGGGGRIGGGGGGGRGGAGGGRRSDMVLKHGITLLGHLDNGLGFYRFSYNGSDKAHVGVMAQEVLTIMPEAVTRGSDGYLQVFYDKLGLKFQSYDQWLASGEK